MRKSVSTVSTKLWMENNTSSAKSYDEQMATITDSVIRTNKPGNYQSEDEMVSSPKHYQSKNGIECIDAMEAATENMTGIFAVDTSNIIKYAFRWDKKGNPIQDVEKIIFYATHLLNKLKEKESESEK